MYATSQKYCVPAPFCQAKSSPTALHCVTKYLHNNTVSLFDLHEVRLGYHSNYGPKEEFNSTVDAHSFTLVYGCDFRLKVMSNESDVDVPKRVWILCISAINWTCTACKLCSEGHFRPRHAMTIVPHNLSWIAQSLSLTARDIPTRERWVDALTNVAKARLAFTGFDCVAGHCRPEFMDMFESSFLTNAYAPGQREGMGGGCCSAFVVTGKLLTLNTGAMMNNLPTETPSEYTGVKLKMGPVLYLTLIKCSRWWNN